MARTAGQGDRAREQGCVDPVVRIAPGQVGQFDARHRVVAAPGQAAVGEHLLGVGVLDQKIGAGTAGERIALAGPGQRVVPAGSFEGGRSEREAAGIQHVVRASCNQPPVLDTGQRVVAVTGDQRIDQDLVGVYLLAGQVVATSAIERIVAGGAPQGVVCGESGQGYGAAEVPGIERVGGGPTGQDRLLDRNQLVAAVTGHAGVGEHVVRVGGLSQLVGPRSSLQRVVAGRSQQRVVTTGSVKRDRAGIESAGVEGVVGAAGGQLGLLDR